MWLKYLKFIDALLRRIINGWFGGKKNLKFKSFSWRKFPRDKIAWAWLIWLGVAPWWNWLWKPEVLFYKVICNSHLSIRFFKFLTLKLKKIAVIVCAIEFLHSPCTAVNQIHPFSPAALHWIKSLNRFLIINCLKFVFFY